MTTEHLKILLMSAARSSLLATMFVRSRIPEEILSSVREGQCGRRRVSASWLPAPLPNSLLSKLRVPHTLSRTHYHVGTECVAHIVQAITDENATLLLIDGVGAYDSISRRAMFRGLADMVDGEKIIPCVRQFYNSPSTFLWGDDTREVRRVRQGEGGEQRDPSMPLLFNVVQHRALVAVQAHL